MTTICWDGKFLAVDSFSTRGDIIEGERTVKLFSCDEYAAVAVCGDYFEMLDFVDWLSKGKEGDMPKSTGTAVLIGRHCGEAFEWDPSAHRVPRKVPPNSAFGSGWKIALGALLAGCNSYEALKIAISKDVYTGGAIQYYDSRRKTFNNKPWRP